MKMDWKDYIFPKIDDSEETLQKWLAYFRCRITFYGPDRNEFGKDLFETYLKD